jgi:hypothetical protein
MKGHKVKTAKMFGKGTSVAPSTMKPGKNKVPNMGIYGLGHRQTSGHLNTQLHYKGAKVPKA